MDYSLLESVVLRRDIPEHNLKEGDLGAIVEIYEPDGIEVEFVKASGETLACVTLNINDLRKVLPNEIITVRAIEQVI